MTYAKSILVVAPGFPAGLLRKFLQDQAPPPREEIEVILSANVRQPYDVLMKDKVVSRAARFCLAPGGKPLAASHLRWLREKLRPFQDIKVLVAQSPYQDMAAAIFALAVLVVSGKTITLWRIQQEGDTGEKWLATAINLDFLLKEAGRKISSCYPEPVKNLLNFIARRINSLFTSSHSPEAVNDRPVNFRPLDASDEAIQNDVKHALFVGNIYLDIINESRSCLKGQKILEIGPGINFGSLLILACHGAEVMAADRFLTPWDNRYHPKFYGLLRDNLKQLWPSLDLTPLETILARKRYTEGVIGLFPQALEELAGVPDQSLDVVLSAAVLEHLFDAEAAFQQMANITKPGGLGIHLIDCRDHRNFSRPLEYLLLSETEFFREFTERHGECGNRLRPREMKHMLSRVGFEIRDIRPYMFADESYLREFVGRLSQASESRYCHYATEELRIVSATFIVEKN